MLLLLNRLQAKNNILISTLRYEREMKVQNRLALDNKTDMKSQDNEKIMNELEAIKSMVSCLEKSLEITKYSSIQNSIKTNFVSTDMVPSVAYGDEVFIPLVSAVSEKSSSIEHPALVDDESQIVNNFENLIIDVSSSEESISRTQSMSIATRPVLLTTEKVLNDRNIDFQYQSNVDEDMSILYEMVSIVRKNLSRIRLVRPRAILQLSKGKLLWGFKSLMNLNPMRISNYTSSDQSSKS